MPAPKPKAPPPSVTWRGIRRRTWIVLIVLETVAVALLVTALLNSDLTALLGAILIGLIYAPIRAGGWRLVQRRFRKRADPAKAEAAFYGRRKK